MPVIIQSRAVHQAARPDPGVRARLARVENNAAAAATPARVAERPGSLPGQVPARAGLVADGGVRVEQGGVRTGGVSRMSASFSMTWPMVVSDRHVPAKPINGYFAPFQGRATVSLWPVLHRPS
jgi:aconitase B